MSKKLWWLVAGDCLTLLLVTLAGFATHGELQEAGLRILTTFVPLLIGWLFVGPFSGIFSIDLALNPRQLWKPAWAMILAVSIAVLLRGWWLNRPVLPLFAAVMAGSCVFGILIWRAVFALVARSRL